MPIRIRSTRKTVRRLKRSRPKAMVPPKSLRYPILSLKRKFFVENWQPNTISVNGFWKQLTLQLSSVPDVTSIQFMFDQYKIAAIKWQLIPRFSSFDGANTTDTTAPGITNQSGTQIHVSYDTRSTTTISGTYTSTTLNSFMEQGRVKTYYGNRMINIYCKPSIVQAVGNITALNYRSPTWLPTTTVTSTHTGPSLFAADHNFNGSFGQSFDIYATVYMMLKNPK